MRFPRMFSAVEATAHCDLPCGVYDPAQARIEAESVKAIQEKYQANEDPVFRTRAIHGDSFRTYVIDRNINYTNVCSAKCTFCAFRRDGDEADAYTLSHEALHDKIAELRAIGGTHAE